MLRKTVKSLSLLIAIMIMFGIFAGCGASDEKKVEGTTTQQASTIGEQKDMGYVPEKELDVTIWNTQGTDVKNVEQPKENIVSDWLVQKTKVKINELYGNGGQQWEPKLTTLVASGNLPNLVLTQGSQGPAHHAKLHQGDLNWELTPEMLQKYAPNVWKFTPDYIWESLKVDGKIYGIPYWYFVDRDIDPNLSNDFLDAFSTPADRITWSKFATNDISIRDDILKKLIPTAKNLDEIMSLIKEKNTLIGDELVLPIKTTDEYIKFMYDIKALGLQENNKPVYATGYNGGDNWIALSVLGAEMLGYKGYYYTGWLNIAQKKMSFGYLDPIFKEAAKIQNKMINDRVIDPESLMHNAEKFKEKVMNGQYAIIATTWIGSTDKINSDLEKAGKKFRFVPFFTQVAQRPEYPAYKEGPTTWGETLSLMKTLNEEQVKQVLNWIDVQFTNEFDEIRFWGPKEAGLYEDTADGKRKFKDEKMQKLLVEGDMTAMDWKDAKGLMSDSKLYSGGVLASGTDWTGVVKWNQGVSKFHPLYFNKAFKISTLQDAMKFPASSQWTKEFVPVPNVQSWSAEYANIPEVQKLWATRSTWDDPFKVAFTAKNEDDFNKKWDDAVANFRKTVDVDKMLDEQTKIVLPLLEKRSLQAN